MNEQLKNTFKNILLGIGVFLLFMYFNDICLYTLAYLGIKVSSFPIWGKILFNLLTQLTVIIIIIYLFKDKLKKAWLDIKQNHQTYFKEYFKYWLLMLAIMMISNAVIMLINGGQIASNEEAIRSQFEISPLYIFISGVLFAPLLEELVFRQGFSCIFKNKFIFIFMSGFIFGGLHVFPMMDSPLDLLSLIPYCTPGFIFAYIYTKTNNVLVPAAIHFMHNGILISMQFILLFFG